MSDHTPGPWKPARSHEDYNGPYFDIDPEDDPEDALEYNARPFVKIVSPSGDVVNAHDLFEFRNVADAWLIAAAPDLYALALAYEAWEADLILCQEAWDGGWADLPKLTEELWDRLLKIQAMRNAAVAKARGLKW